MERILCAAIWYNDGKPHLHQPKNIVLGYVMCGRRHHNIIALHADLAGRPTRMGSSEQGFLTSSDRFVDRKEAMGIAYKAGQVLEQDYNNHKELYSEDLY